MARLLNADEIMRQLSELDDWSRIGDEIVAEFAFDDFAEALAFVNRVGDLAEQAQHHPDIDIRWNKVRLALTSHDVGGLTQTDIELAIQISAES
ncbi:4a-hydroxytetrahydrobiopterin dehydratase [Friedmanniella endophytica]|uniref:Putative pterin-4-alpha-carbinolamine dehydratase n=1 Tax=Microlunatus kandeliicorticis TaxID=1759536 RepID=A0A7W3P6G5_9ACTN|nr:4a-hydroxytetrahydrobiopterin dehydratase [Microlunatus kandeliicorticis]MBA8794954.1 4a-hydroxytetrahydrobiopterin dehydratase [Microlunatus kandeliicorticis]